ncbi:MAG: hypothetical protein IID18_02035, partial [Nitrospinae bacterium]|nr:hypothetical protein [Nitrospinota bacterium]
MNDPQDTLRQAAILIASLDRDSADLMISKLSPRQAASLRRAVVELSEINPQEQNDIITRFVRTGPMTASLHTSGIELDGRLAEQIDQVTPSHFNETLSDRLADDTDSSKISSHDNPPGDVQPFRFLHEGQSEQLASLLLGEHPQTIAVVLAHLPPERSAELLAAFPSRMQVDVVQRLVHLEQTDPEILRDIEQEIESWLHGKIGGIGQRFAGFSAAATIIRASDPRIKSQLLSDLSQHDAGLARRLEGATTPAPQPVIEPFRFDELESFNAMELGRVLSMASNEVIVLALAGASTSMFDRAIKLLDASEARTIRHQIDRLGPTSLRDIEAAQSEL